MPEPVRAFLREFGGLKLEFPVPRLPSVKTDIVLDPCRAIAAIYKERVDDYSARVGSELTVIGQADQGHLTVMMDSEGRVYAGSDDNLVFVEVSGPAALDALCCDVPLQPVK